MWRPSWSYLSFPPSPSSLPLVCLPCRVVLSQPSHMGTDVRPLLYLCLSLLFHTLTRCRVFSNAHVCATHTVEPIYSEFSTFASYPLLTDLARQMISPHSLCMSFYYFPCLFALTNNQTAMNYLARTLDSPPSVLCLPLFCASRSFLSVSHSSWMTQKVRVRSVRLNRELTRSLGRFPREGRWKSWVSTKNMYISDK